VVRGIGQRLLGTENAIQPQVAAVGQLAGEVRADARFEFALVHYLYAPVPARFCPRGAFAKLPPASTRASRGGRGRKRHSRQTGALPAAGCSSVIDGPLDPPRNRFTHQKAIARSALRG